MEQILVKLTAWKKPRICRVNGRYLYLEVYPDGQSVARSIEQLGQIVTMLEKNHVTHVVREVENKEWIRIEVNAMPSFAIAPFLASMLEWDVEEYIPNPERKAA